MTLFFFFFTEKEGWRFVSNFPPSAPASRALVPATLLFSPTILALFCALLPRVVK